MNPKILSAKAGSDVPADAVLAMQAQNFQHAFRDPAAPSHCGAEILRYRWRRVGVFATTLLIALFLSSQMYIVLSENGLTLLDALMTLLFGLGLFGITFGAVNSSVGFVRLLSGAKSQCFSRSTEQMSVALLVPVFNEETDRVFGNALAMLRQLQNQNTSHTFSLFILSDTTDPDIAEKELGAFSYLRHTMASKMNVFYRRRSANTGRKAGNIADWCRRWGAACEAMLVLDADSLMSAQTIVTLTDAMADNPRAGLVQSVPRLINARSLYGRLQQFANAYNGPLYMHGYAYWCGVESNYWGHNAIIRTRAFAASAGLPALRGPKPIGGEILSHDFVEAALLRRAGWEVLILPDSEGSYEETPQTLIDYILRDRRWCRGNMQHLGVLLAAGCHPISRFHILHGIMNYLSALLWLLFLIIGAVVAHESSVWPMGTDQALHAAFPQWPFLDSERAIALLGCTLIILMLPKLLGLFLVTWHPRMLGVNLDRFSVLIGGIIEIVISALYAPILMIQQSSAVLRAFCGIGSGWQPQRRGSHNVELLTTIRFHLIEAVFGLMIGTGILTGIITPWMAPIAVSLVFAIPLSLLSGLPLSAGFASLLATPECKAPPEVILKAASAREQFANLS